MVSETEKQTLKDTWALVKDSTSLNDLGLEMFVRLFDKNPEMLPLFPFADKDTTEKLRGSKRVARHGLNVMKKVDAAIDGLDDMGAVAANLGALGEKHIKYKATKSHFQYVGAALLFVLEQTLSDRWTPEVESAWTNIFGIIATVMGEKLP